MTAHFGASRLLELRKLEQTKGNELAAALKMFVKIPDLLIAYLAGRQRRIWFQRQSQRAQRIIELDAQNKEIWDKLYADNLYRLHDADNTVQQAAYRRFRGEYKRKIARYQFELWFTKALWQTGRYFDIAWLWAAKHRPIKFIDISWRAAILAVSTVSFFGFAVWSFYSWELLSTKKAPPNLPTKIEEKLTELRAELVFPIDGLPTYWANDSANILYSGFDRSRGSIKEFSHLKTLCSASAIVVFGTASLQGSDARNEKLAKERGLKLSKPAVSAISQCSQKPTILVAAMWRPISTVNDGSQRKAFAIAVGQKGTTLSGNNSPLVIASKILGGATTDKPSNYRSVQLCRYEARENMCNWTVVSDGTSAINPHPSSARR